MSSYPKDLIPALKKICTKLKKRKFSKLPALPSDDELKILLETAFHASFLTEERRRPGFRIIYMPINSKSRGEESDFFRNEDRFIPFDIPRSYTISEINRLSPAAELSRLMICVSTTQKTEGKPVLNIWGLLDVGENWWKFVHHETSGGKPPPNFFVVTSLNPGELSISVQGEVLLVLKGGSLIYPKRTAIWEGPINDFLQPARNQLYKEAVSVLGDSKWDKDGTDDDYPHRLYNYYLERVLFYIREKGHGGTLILIPNHLSKDDIRVTDRIIIKYSCEYNCSWDLLIKSLINHREYFNLYFPLWRGKIEMSKNNFQKYHLLSAEEHEIEEGLGDMAQAIASLTSIDGAVVLTDRFSVLGFGAEVIAVSPSLKTIVQANGTTSSRKRISIEEFGTRHRSAFRFCSSFEESVAFVVSQDGGVKAIKRVGKEVILWPDINTGAMGI